MRAGFARAHNDSHLDYEEPEAFAPPSYVVGMAAEIWRIREQADRQGDIALLLSGNQEALIHWNFALAAEVALKALEKGN